jgi:hypothetical protein
VSLATSTALLTDLVALVLGVSLEPRIILLLLFVVCPLLLLVGRSRIVVNDRKGRIESLLKTLLVQLHKSSLGLTVDRVSDQWGKGMSRHEIRDVTGMRCGKKVEVRDEPNRKVNLMIRGAIGSKKSRGDNGRREKEKRRRGREKRAGE